MQQKLMSYEIFTEIFKSANRQLSSMATESVASSKPVLEVGSALSGPEGSQVQILNPGSCELSLTASEIKLYQNNTIHCQEASVEMQSKDYDGMDEGQSRWKKQQSEVDEVLQQVLRQCNGREQNPVCTTTKQLKNLLLTKDEAIRELTQSRQNLESTVRSYKNQLSMKQKEYENFRQIISNLEEDIMEFRSEIKKSELQAKQIAEKHAKEVQGYQQQLAELRQSMKEARVKNTLIIKDKDTELLSKDNQLSESIDTNSRLLDELIVLRKDKDIRKEQVDKQHQLIIQYEKRNEQTNREVNRLTEELMQLKQELGRQAVGLGSMGSTMLIKNSSRSTAATKTAATLNTSGAKSKRSTSVPLRRCEMNIKAKLFGLKKDCAQLKEQLRAEQEQLGQFMIEMTQSILNAMQSVHSEHIAERDEEVEALRKEMIRLKVEVFELQLKQESARQTQSGQTANRHSDGFWMTKLLESTNGLESAKSNQLNRTAALGRETVINNTGGASSTKRNSARRLAKDYDVQRRAVQESVVTPGRKP